MHLNEVSPNLWFPKQLKLDKRTHLPNKKTRRQIMIWMLWFVLVLCSPKASATWCPTGSTSTGFDSMNCVPCEPGQFGETVRIYGGSLSSRCFECPENTTSYAPGSRFCRRINGPCPRGYLQTSAGDCERCQTDERYDLETERCVPCPENEGSVGGLPLICAPCVDVIKARIDNSRCVPGWIPGDFEFPDSTGTCSAGYHIYETDVGRFCKKCSSGFFSSRPNSVACVPCPDGSISENYGAASCERCADGTVSNDARTECLVQGTNCAVGSFPFVDSSGYSQCVPNECTVSDDGSYSCPACTGTYFTSFSFDGCAPCADAQVRGIDLVCGCRGPFAENRGLVDGICTQCERGSYGRPIVFEGDNECVKCPAGTFRVVPTEERLHGSVCPRCTPPTSCERCAPGSVSRQDGATRCEECPAGTFSYGVGDPECLAFGAASEAVRFNGALDLSVKAALERLQGW